MQNNSTRSRTDSAAATSAGVDEPFCTARVLRQTAHRNHFHRLLTLVFNVCDRRGKPSWTKPASRSALNPCASLITASVQPRGSAFIDQLQRPPLVEAERAEAAP